MTFSILLWNIWLYNQLNGEAGANHLLSELKRITDQCNPDFISLNEVLKRRQSTDPFVLEFLKQECGYAYNHYTALSAHDDNWLDGLALCSRTKITAVQEIPLCKNSYATRRGYPGYELKALAANVTLPKQSGLRIIVTHATPLIPLRIDAFKDHYIGINNINRLVRTQEYSKNTILVGDMNEWRLMPGSLRQKVSDVMHSRTGSVLKPTWRYNSRRFTPLRLNLDYMYWSKECDFRLKEFKVLSSHTSDHRTLLAVFEYS